MVALVTEDVVKVIQATLAPVFLVNGTGIFLNFTQARLFRVTDRLRALGVDIERAGGDGVRASSLREQQRSFLARGRILRNAIIFGVVAISLTILTAILLVGEFLVPFPIPARLAIFCFTGGLLSVMGCLALVVRDTLLSYQLSRLEAESLASISRP